MAFENCRIHSRLKRIGSFNSISQSNRAVGKEINAILGAQTILIWTMTYISKYLFSQINYLAD